MVARDRRWNYLYWVGGRPSKKIDLHKAQLGQGLDASCHNDEER